MTTTVTTSVVFTDLVGSTELAARLGPAAEGVRSVHFGLFGANLGGVRWQQGRLDEILPVIAQAAADNPGYRRSRPPTR